jgi:hypothetical protein
MTPWAMVGMALEMKWSVSVHFMVVSDVFTYELYVQTYIVAFALGGLSPVIPAGSNLCPGIIISPTVAQILVCTRVRYDIRSKAKATYGYLFYIRCYTNLLLLLRRKSIRYGNGRVIGLDLNNRDTRIFNRC